MKTRILNYGSLNIDYVYKIPHFVRPGETLSSASLETFSGGKGANQTTALAKAGACVSHAGKIGEEGLWLKEKLEKDKVDVSFIKESSINNGHACIQVDEKGQNAIILFAGANKKITKDEIDATLKHFVKGDYLLLQNEINHVDYLIKQGHKNGLRVCLNPAPMNKEVLSYPLKLVDILIVNETEAKALAQKKDYRDALDELEKLYPSTELILTIGDQGVIYSFENKKLNMPAIDVEVVDTTGAGDTFIGYYLAAKIEGRSVEDCLRFAIQASTLCVSRRGAQDSIPIRFEVEKMLS